MPLTFQNSDPARPPAGEKWPTAANGDKLSFIAALDFAELPRTKELPEDGLLALYWDRDWRKRKGKRDFVAATRTFFIAPGEPSREPRAPKSTLPIGYKPLRGAAMPIAGDPKLLAGELRGRADAAQVRNALGELELQGVYPHHVLGSPIENHGAVLQGMSGYFNPTLGYLTEASRERFTPAERTGGKWTLLAQFEEQEGFDLARGSKLYFVILERDLELGRFDRVIGIEDSD